MPSLRDLRRPLLELHKTLVDAANNAASKMQHQLESLQAKAARAESRQSEVIERHARLLSNALYPNKTLQEREIAGIYFIASYGEQLLADLYDLVHTECLDHQVVFLG